MFREFPVSLFLLAFVWQGSAFASSVVRIDSFFAPSLGRVMKIAVLRPRGNEKDTLPVLYLLHGWSGDYRNWLDKTKISNYAAETGIIIVMPEGENSWYVNSATNPADRFEKYIVSDVPHYVFTHFPADSTRQAIAGLSMGGYGAVRLALLYPEKFRFAGDLSGALIEPTVMDVFDRDSAKSMIFPSIKKAFGERGEREKRAAEFYPQLHRASPHQFPYFYVTIGIQDQMPGFFRAQRAFTDSLQALGIPYEYHETNGGHDWQFWDRAVQLMLRRLIDCMK